MLKGSLPPGSGRKGAVVVAERRLKITWVKSAIGYPEDQRATIRALGLRRLHQSVVRPDSPQLSGMLSKVQHLVRVEEVS